MFVGEKAAERVDHEQQAALTHGRLFDQQLLPLRLFAVRSHERFGGYTFLSVEAARVPPFCPSLYP